MTSKAIKTALKEAREFVKLKDYPQAIAKCSEIIEADPKNYMGLVLMGAAYQENNKKEAAACLRRAVDCASDPTVALQGLANCAEIEELPGIYKKLLQLLPDKAIEYHNKIGGLPCAGKVWEDCISILEGEVNTEHVDVDSARIKSAWLNLAKVFLKQNDVPEKWAKLYEKSLEIAIKNPDVEFHLDTYKRYLKLLFKLGFLVKILENASAMAEMYPQEIYPLEWICKVYSENIEHPVLSCESVLKKPIKDYVERLLELNSDSSLGLCIQATDLFYSEQYVQARDLLLRIRPNLSNPRVGLEYLARCYVKLGAYKMAEIEYNQLDIKNSEYALCLSHDYGNKDNLERAVVLCKQLVESCPCDDVALSSLVRAHFKLDQKDEALSALSKLQELNLMHVVHILEAEFLKTPTEAIAFLESDGCDDFNFEFLKGKSYLAIEQYEKSLTCLLKATKQRPYYSECFLSLGQLYSALNDWTRARKCFEKCIYLNPTNQAAITYLSAIYRKNHDWDLNYALLQNSVKYFQGFKWPLFQMGLHNLSLQKFDEAIDSFRSALRYDLTDILCWEGLADAYHQRGSYNSAMKVYQKIMELDPDNPYPKLQVGAVKLILHMYTEAIACFHELLETHPDYLPALKGAADAHYNYSNYLLTQCLIGRCKEHLQKATEYLQRVFTTGKRDMIWLWRLLANVFVATARMSSAKAFLHVSGKLAGQEEDVVVLQKEELFEFAGRFYTYAIKLNPEDGLVWHELSLCYYYFATKYDNNKTKTSHLKLALDACKQSITLQQNRWQNWNLLGVICATEEIHNLALAQHCFIKALQIEKKSHSAWTNLGILYLKQSQMKLANKAFSRAQQSDTGFVNAWIGQAIIAERIGQSDEAMDLFRHCTQLDFNVESATGYAYWVCNILSNPENLKQARYKYAIENMNAVPVALDSMNWYYTAEDLNSALEPLSYLGFLNARQSLTANAIRTYQLAINKSEGVNKDKMLCNMGYCYLKLNQPLEAIKAFDEVAEASFKSCIGLAWARFRASQFQESYSVYNLALEWMANSDAEKSLILVAMSAMVYAAQGESDTKSILLQCIGLSNPPIQALFSACALGILHRDSNLINAIMEALKPFENDSKQCHHIAFLTAQIHVANNQSKKGLMHLVSKVHAFPDRPLLRRVLADYLFHIYKKSNKHMAPASKIAESTVILELRNPQRTREMSLNASKYLAVASEAMKRVDRKRSMKLAQRAIHLNPMCQEAWNVLVSCKT